MLRRIIKDEELKRKKSATVLEEKRRIYTIGKRNHPGKVLIDAKNPTHTQCASGIKFSSSSFVFDIVCEFLSYVGGVCYLSSTKSSSLV